MDDNSVSPVTRVMLWAPPRTTSRAILKCLTGVPNSQMWCEPFLFTDFCGIDGNHSEAYLHWLKEYKGVKDFQADLSQTEGGFLAREASFSKIKQQLESSPPNINLIFCKEMVWSFNGHYEHIPQGFRHTFLIRHPYKVFRSWKKMMNEGIAPSKQMKLTELPLHVMPKGYHFIELYDMYHHIKTTIDPDSLILDVDDLLNNPSIVLKAYCEAVNIPYSDDLLQWKAGRKSMDTKWKIAKEEIAGHNRGGHNNETFQSTGFIKPGPCPKREDVDEDVLYCSDVIMKYYKELYDNRMKF